MPCEGCQVQFTVFRRKRSCNDCRRYYCSNCLNTIKRSNAGALLLCQRCAIFAKRPLLRADLLQMKPKDLIFYLQSKHISTAGCVEKDELVCLVLNHAQECDAHRMNGQSSPDMSSHASADTTNSFDSIKQTCQNFFTNISDNLSESLSNFDGRGNTKTQQQPQQWNVPTMEQPRVCTREIPTYAGYQNRMAEQTRMPSVSSTRTTPTTTITTGTTPTIHSGNVSQSSENATTFVAAHNSSNSSPTYSGSSVNNEIDLQNVSTSSTTATASKKDIKSDCECSDDEMIADFSARHSLKTDNSHSNVQHNSADAIGPSTSNTSTNYSKIGSISSKVDICDVSSQSSFEELGAIGGTSDDSRPTTETNSSVNMDQWLVLEVPTSIAAPCNENINQGLTSSNASNTERRLLAANAVIEQPEHVQRLPQQALPKVVRRRSDSYLNRRHDLTPTNSNAHSNLNQSTLGNLALDVQFDTSLHQEATTSRPRISCTRCGKNKTNLRHQVEKMRRHLESAQMSDEDIKREIAEFLEYIEMRTKSIDQSDTETVGSSLSAANLTQIAAVTSPIIENHLDDNDGIHVYATTSANDGGDSRFINLEDYGNLDDLECLTVKQLKEILMLHRVDYKGCCEKQELLERVERLWKNLKSAPAVEKLPTDELCKICMDAPIECVILECGHMATCTNCGKVLSECPICRQYIVRVVRFFRA